MISDYNIKQALSQLNQERIKRNAKKVHTLNSFQLLRLNTAVQELESLGFELETCLNSKIVQSIYINKNK